MFAKIKVALGVAVASAMSLSSLVFQPQIALAANETFDSKADYAASFNGVNSYGVTGGPVIPASGDYTVEAWVYNDGGDAMREIVAQGDDTANFYMGDIWGDMRVAGAGDLPKSKKAQWYHLAVTKSDSGSYIWVNGQKIAQSFSLGNPAALPLNVGRQFLDYGEFWKGKIDEVRIYSSDRSTSVATDMNSWGNGGEASLLAYYDFNAPVANPDGTYTVADLSGAAVAKPLTLHNFSAADFVDVAEKVDWGTDNRDALVTFPRPYLNSQGGWTSPTGYISYKALVVGGGGGGGAWVGGGGGAGGFKETSETNLTAGTKFSVSVGMGGSGAAYRDGNFNRYGVYNTGNNGYSTNFNDAVISLGGGKGGSFAGSGQYDGVLAGSGANGGGAGGSQDDITGSAPSQYATGGASTVSGGFKGGDQAFPMANLLPGAGGAGAGGAGGNASSDGRTAGNGGPGVLSTITNIKYAGGGGGGVQSNLDVSDPGVTGSAVDGGGAGAGPTQVGQGEVFAAHAVANTGGGGGGAGMSEFYTSVGGDGASGVVILRLKAQAIASQTSVNACDGSTTLNGVKVAAAHPKIFYIDSDKDQKLDANYMAYRVTSTTARSDLWVQVSGFTGGSVTLANSADSSQPVGTVAANGTGAVYFLAKASEETNKAQSHVVKVFDRKPGSGGAVPLFTCNSGFSQVAETIKADSNKVNSVTTTTVSAIGTTFTITVLGDSGTIGNGNATDGRLLWLSPASKSNWPTGALRLEDTVITTYSDAARATLLKTFNNTLALNTASGLTANNRQYYKAVYTFRIIGNATSVASISPSAMISSGNQVKHVDFDKIPTGTGTKVNVVNPTQTVTVAGSASSTAQVRNNGTTRVTYTLTIKNTGSKDVELDELYDRGDDGDDEDDEEEDHEEYVKGSTKKNGEEHEDGEEDDDDKQKHVFSGPFKIPAKSSITIEYQVDVKTCQKGEKYKKEHKSGGSIGGSDDDEDEDHDGHDDDGDGDHDGEDDDEDHGHKIGSSKTTHSNVEVSGKCGEPAQAVKVTNQVQDPVVKTGTAVPVAATSATLYGTVDPNGVSGLPVKFSYSTSPSLVGATSVNLANTTSAGDPYVVKSSITGLTPGTRYYYRLTVVQPGNVEKSGAIYHLDTELLPGVPTAETAPVTLISNTDKGALFTGAITAARVSGGAKARFEWAADNSNGACTSVGSVSNSGNLKNGSADAVLTNAGATDMTHRVTGFTASAKYCVRIVALHGTGYTTRVVGGWVAFTQAPKTPQSISWNNVMPPLPAGGSTTVAATATSSLAVTYTSVDPTVCSVNASTGAVSAVADFGLCSITATQDGDDTYYPALPKTISFEIVPPKVVTSSLPAGEYQSAFTSTTLEAEGGNGTYSNWSVVGTLPAGLTLSSQGVLSGTPTAAGLYTITVTVESNGVTSAPRDLSIVIETASIAVIANDATVTFGDAVPAIGYTVSSFLGGDSALNTAPKCETNYQVGDAAGAAGKATFCADAWDPNYTVTYVSGELTVEKFAVVVAASAKAKQNLSNGTNRPDPAFEYTLTPALPGGQTVADVLPAGVNFSRSSGEAPGNYSITPSAASTGSNYDVTFVDGTLTVQQPQIVPALTATDFEVTFGDALGLGLVADAKDDQTDVSGTWVFSYVDENNQIQVVTSSTELPAGLYTITAEFTPTDGATFYGPVSTVMNLTVNKKVVTITSEEAEKLVNSLDPDLEYSAAGFLGGDTVDDLGQVLVTREPGEAPGTYDVTTSGGSNPNYTVQHVKATLFITKLTIVPVVNADGSNARQVSVTCQGAKPGSTVTLTIGAVTLGTYTVAANGTCAATKLTIPSSIPDGAHTITAAGEFPSGASLSDSTPALFVAPPVNNGGNTGGNTGGNSGGGVVVKPGKLKATKTFSGFRPGSHHLTTAMKSQLKAWVAANPKLNRLTCTGFTMGKTVLPIDEKLSWNRAFFACQYVKQIKPSVKIVWVKGKQETVFGDPIRRVELTLTNY